MKKKNKGKLIVGLLPFIIYLLLAIIPAGLGAAGGDEVPYIICYIRCFYMFCVFFWPSTIIGIIFIIWYIFSKKDKMHENINKSN